ncbi:hypothetical protein JET14_11800 [Martelella lutilitoris]|uniref:Uncharacterized protein n=1 Tax=Martelella lutilitoris TaxID=2583532 RepID=A0A7T7HGZ7_9HYPH|nr:hypothetical protein [Martelella lutilitoris]QQM29025.1 hypothetical protein JET14_11800 [Martelella lutilitoris]
MNQFQKYKPIAGWLVINALLPYLIRLSGVVTVENSIYVGVLLMVLLQGLNYVLMRKHIELAIATITLNVIGFVLVGYFSIVYAIYPIVKVILLPLAYKTGAI